jgi:ferritin-like metal-binding protein YciE
MPIVSLRDLYVAELQDLLDAEQNILAELPAMAASATSTTLRRAFDAHFEETRVHVERLELLLRKLDAEGHNRPCEAIRGLIAEGRRRVAETERGEVLDAALIASAQRIEHYEIAVYGCARTFAQTLGDDDARKLLQQTLDEEGAADHRLTKIAEHGINRGAGEDLRADTDEQRARLRYVPASRVPDLKYREFRICNVAGEDLGSLDGFIIDPRSDRPEYLVVDSGGWFVGQRYLVPVSALRPDESGRTLKTDLDRKSIAAHPPFNPDAFARVTPESCDAGAADDCPTWLMTGVWMTETSGFASVPPRAEADFAAKPASPQTTPPKVQEAYPANELMVAREEPQLEGEAAQERDTEPRIERYPER